VSGDSAAWSGVGAADVTATVEVAVIETSGLGGRSYVVTGGGMGVVVDPQRDIDRVLSLVADRRTRITHVLETHLHNDYVSGGLALSRAVSTSPDARCRDVSSAGQLSLGSSAIA
jgi:glyoxylase-like metal-dependent hydrolase (beta-lactamase superfamily II)